MSEHECPSCGHVWDDECWGPPMTAEERERLRQENPIAYRTMVYAENELLRTSSHQNALITLIKKKGPI